MACFDYGSMDRADQSRANVGCTGIGVVVLELELGWGL
jgi:hypothetical protein